MKNKKEHILFILFLSIMFTSGMNAVGETDSFQICPLCSKDGGITCPVGYEAGCQDETPGDTKPKCLFYGDKYIPGCWKFIGVKKLDFDFPSLGLPPTTMIKITGGGETYTLNREIVGCKKL